MFVIHDPEHGAQVVIPRLLKSCVAMVAVLGMDARYRGSVAGPPYFVPHGRVMEHSRNVPNHTVRV